MIGSNTNCLVLRESEKPGAMFLFEQAEPRKAEILFYKKSFFVLLPFERDVVFL